MQEIFRLHFWAVLVALFLFISAAVADQSSQTPTLIPLVNAPISGLIEFPSQAIGQSFFIPYSVPKNFDQLNASSSKIVVYFLHGYMLEEGSDPFDPLSRALMENQGNAVKGMIGNKFIANSRELADALDIVIIHVNGGSCVYRNAKDLEEPQFETHIINELIPFVEAKFNTTASHQGRGLVGSSMGAMGAAYYGIKYADLFGAVACRSGKYGLADRGAAQESDFPQPLQEWGYHWPRVFGETIDYTTYKQHAPILMIENFKETNLVFRIDIGANDYPDLRNSSRQFHEKMLALDIPHYYRETPDGHTWIPSIVENVAWATHILREQTSLEDLKKQFPDDF